MVEESCNDGGDGNQRHGDDDSGEQIKHQPSPENDNAPAATCDGKESEPDKRPVDQHDIITSDNVPLECTTIATSVAVGDPEQTQDGQNRRESAPGICFVPGPDFVSNVASNSYEPAPPEPITETSPPVDNDNYDNVNIMISDVIAIEVDHAVQAEPIETVKYCGKEMHSSSFKCLVCSVLTVAAAVVIIPTALHLNTKNQVSEAGAEAGMLERKPQKKPESFWRETCSVYSNMEGFNNTSSPQSQAVEWILSDTNAIMRGEPKQADFLKDNDRPGLLRERYVLAVLYYSLGGEDWARQEEFMSWDHQCNWNRIKCDERMRVTSIRLGKRVRCFIAQLSF